MTAAIQWRTDYERALREAQAARRLVLAHFWLEGRPLYLEMNRRTFADAEVIRLSNERFVPVSLDLRTRADLFERTIGGRGALGTAIVDGSGDVVSALPGFADTSRYLDFLRGALAGYPKLRAARAAAARAPADPQALGTLAETYEALQSPRRAEEQCEKLLQLGAATKIWSSELRRSVAFAHERIARFRALRGKNREAAPHIAEYRRLDPDNRLGRMERVELTDGIVAWIERRLKDSMRILETALAKYPSGAEIDQTMLALAVVLHESGNDTRALSLLDALLRQFPQSRSLPQAREQIEHIRNPPPDHVH